MQGWPDLLEDTDRDGFLSDIEGRAYAECLLRDLSLRLNGLPLKPLLSSVKVPQIGEIKEGSGEIQVEFTADLPSGVTDRKLTFENHHQPRISAYLMNALVPQDSRIRILAQDRNEDQSFYELTYSQADGPTTELPNNTFRPSIGFASIFRLGMRHIAEGTDHLLFLLALLLPAPLVAFGSRWVGFAGVRHSLRQVLKVVTAFTLGHSITLVLAALGLLRVPARSIEVLIAVSILITAAHAFRPLFPGREAGIAAFFGLIHGLAFAATLGQLGLTWSERLVGILGFSLGIESMQLIVVAATMPSLVLLSRTRGYSVLRVGGALFAGLASVGWIAERLFHVRTPVDAMVNTVASHALWIAGILFLTSLGLWLQGSRGDSPSPRNTDTPGPVVSEQALAGKATCH